MTYEVCPHCDNEVEIPEDKPSNCPKCNEIILPCSACKLLQQGKCDWDKNTRCSAFPVSQIN